MSSDRTLADQLVERLAAATQVPDPASIESRARQLLAEEYDAGERDGGYPSIRDVHGNKKFLLDVVQVQRGEDPFTQCSIRAIARALSESHPAVEQRIGLADQVADQFKKVADTLQDLQAKFASKIGPAWDVLHHDLDMINIDERFGEEEMANYQAVQDGLSNFAQSLDRAIEDLRFAVKFGAGAADQEAIRAASSSEASESIKGNLLPWNTKRGR